MLLKSNWALAALLAAAACGGDGPTMLPNPPVPAPPPASAISITSLPTASLVENTDGVVYTAQTNAGTTETVTFDIAGADATGFSIDASGGTVSINAAPNFELPTDADANNVFDLTITASTSTSSDTLDLAITVTDDPGGAITTRELVSGLDQPVFLTELPDGTGRLIVLQRLGEIVLLAPDSGMAAPIPFLDVSGTVSTGSEQGLLGIAFSPDFANDRTFYINVTNLAGDTEIRRFTTQPNTLDQADPLSEDIVLRITQPFSNHNAGWIGFDPNGLLIIPTGDGGSAGDPMDLAQNPNSLLGKVLRIDITADDFPIDDLRDYAIPPGNTFTDPTDGLPEIFAIGLRNPFRSSIDPVTGDLFLGEVGQDEIEEVNRLPLTDSSFDFGWNEREGTQSFEGPDNPSFTDPVAEYPHGSGPLEGNSITGGFVYNGPLEALDRDYVFADFVTANIWAIPERALTTGSTIANTEFEILTQTLAPASPASPITNIASFGEDAEGNLYIITISGSIFVIEAG